MSNTLSTFIAEIVQLNLKVGSISLGQRNFLQEFLKLNPEIHTVFETGFHAGLSAATILDTRPDLQVISSDIFWFDYTRKAKLILDIYYPKRHTLLAGNSINTLPTFFRQFPTYQPDLVFIDGGHEDPVPLLDLYHIVNHIKPDTWVIVDDYCEAHGSHGVNKAVNLYINNRVLKDCNVMRDDTDRGWLVAKRSDVPVPELPLAHDETEIEYLLRDTNSHYQ